MHNIMKQQTKLNTSKQKLFEPQKTKNVIWSPTPTQQNSTDNLKTQHEATKLMYYSLKPIICEKKIT